MYGKWEDYDKKMLPLLDACGGHFGPTPDSNGELVYHYHVQDKAPYTVGCHGPSADGGLVGIAECRALYPDICGDDDVTEFTIKGTTFMYDRYCPCFDGAGFNIPSAIEELPALSTDAISYPACDFDCGDSFSCFTTVESLLGESEIGGGCATEPPVTDASTATMATEPSATDAPATEAVEASPDVTVDEDSGTPPTITPTSGVTKVVGSLTGAAVLAWCM
jgi:hypothetical protein